jgi:hypothetical protein
MVALVTDSGAAMVETEVSPGFRGESSGTGGHGMSTDIETESPDTIERGEVTFIERRPKPAVFAAPVVMALWKERVFEAFQPPDLGRTA